MSENRGGPPKHAYHLHMNTATSTPFKMLVADLGWSADKCSEVSLYRNYCT